MMTPTELAHDLGTYPATVYRAAKRLGIALPLTARAIKRLRREITPGVRGHWTRGKARNHPPDDWPDVRDRVNRWLEVPRLVAVAEGRSRRGLARKLAVSDRTIRRWLDGVDQPPRWAVLVLRRATAVKPSDEQ